MDEGRDFAVILGSLAGSLFLAISKVNGVEPCALCWVFWASIAALLAELVLSQRRFARFAVAPFVIPPAFFLLCNLSPGSKALIIESSPRVKMANESVRLNLTAREVRARPTGIFAIVTNCPLCSSLTLVTKVENLVKTYGSISVVAHPAKADAVKALLANPALTGKVVVVSEDWFQKVGIKETSPPMFLQFRDGKLVQQRTAFEANLSTNGEQK